MNPVPRKPQTYTVEVNFGEYCLLAALRLRFRYKEITVMMRDGVPQRIIKAFESEELTQAPPSLPPPDVDDRVLE